jgi:hypothetical protein
VPQILYIYLHILVARPSPTSGCPRYQQSRNRDPSVHCAPVTKQPLDPRSNIKLNLFDHRVNLYNSKPMAVITHVPVYYVIQYNLIFTVFYIIFFFILLSITHFHKIEFKVIKSVFHVSCKHACLVYKTIMLCRKKNNKYPSDFYSLVSYGSFIQSSKGSTTSKSMKRPIISPNLELKLVLSSN